MLIGRSAAALFGLFGLLACLLAIVSGVGAEHTIANAQKLDQQFRQAAAAIEAFEKSENRLPDPDELGGLLPERTTSVYQIMLMPDGFDQCDGDAQPYSHVAEGAYVLAAWRGEWWECFAPAANKSTLSLRESDFTMTGSIGLDWVAFGLLALASFLFAARLWTRKGARENGAAGED